MPPIQVGQQWKTREGKIVVVTMDRGEDSYGGWRWALSNSHIAQDSGAVGMDGRQHPSDLVELINPEQR